MIIQKLDIMDVNDRNVNSFNNKIKTMNSIVCFHANWCGHCQQLNPEWDIMVKNLKNKNLYGLLARIEAKNLDKAECDKDIKGYPTIRVFKNGTKHKDYSGKREAKELTEFVESILSKSPKLMEQAGGKRRNKRKKRKRRKKTKTKRKRRKKRKNKTQKKRKNKTQKKKRRSSLRETFFDMISSKFN